MNHLHRLDKIAPEFTKSHSFLCCVAKTILSQIPLLRISQVLTRRYLNDIFFLFDCFSLFLYALRVQRSNQFEKKCAKYFFLIFVSFISLHKRFLLRNTFFFNQKTVYSIF